jgi:membrane protein implicated in regulation of membrane protease activity
MTYKLSYDIKSSALIIALVLVPIVVLIFVVVIALACSNYWSIHSLKGSCLSCLSYFSLWKQQRRKKLASDPEASPVTHHLDLTRATEASDIRIEFEPPIRNREHT